MVAVRILPLMLVVVCNSILFWVAIGGLLGPWTFVAIPANALAIGGAVLAIGRYYGEMKPTEQDSEEDEKNFVLKASTLSVWLPCIVGDQRHMYLTAAVSNIIAKTLVLAAAVIMAVYGLQEKVHDTHFLGCASLTAAHTSTHTVLTSNCATPC